MFFKFQGDDRKIALINAADLSDDSWRLPDIKINIRTGNFIESEGEERFIPYVSFREVQEKSWYTLNYANDSIFTLYRKMHQTHFVVEMTALELRIAIERYHPEDEYVNRVRRIICSYLCDFRRVTTTLYARLTDEGILDELKTARATRIAAQE